MLVTVMTNDWGIDGIQNAIVQIRLMTKKRHGALKNIKFEGITSLFPNMTGQNPVDFLKLFSDQEIMNLTIEQTNESIFFLENKHVHNPVLYIGNL